MATLTLELPDELAAALAPNAADLPRTAFEALALQAYRTHSISAAQLLTLLGFSTRDQLDSYLKSLNFPPDLTPVELERQIQSLNQLIDHR